MSRITEFRSHPTLFLLLAALVSTGCVSTQLAPISLQGAAYEPLPDEIDLWHTTREEERLLLRHAEIYDDPDLLAYLHELVDRLEPPGMAANRDVRFRVTVLDDPSFNAFAYPHGAIYIHSGLLAAADTEDQIAAILAHEMTHVERRHMARHERARWNRRVPIQAVTLAASLALAVEEVDAWDEGDYEEAELLSELSEGVLLFGFELAARVSARGYGRRLEREADEGMLRKLRANGYDVAHVMAFYEGLGLADSGDPTRVLAHSLGSDVAQRLRALEPASEAVAPSLDSRPLLAPPELARLLGKVFARSPGTITDS